MSNDLSSIGSDILPRGTKTALADCLHSPDKALSLPASCYQSKTVLNAETQRIFRTQWIGLGRADRIDKPGQYETIDIAGVPLILIKDQQGKLRAFNNACRHRGARLLEGTGECNRIRCPFHCWNYKTSGEFVSAPHMGTSTILESNDWNLIEFSLQLHLGFIFVCFADKPPDFNQHLGNFDELHAPWPLDKLHSARRIALTVNCNWKLFLDVFNEYYHLQYVHPDSINSVYRIPEAADITTGSFATQYGENDGSGGLLESEQDFALPAIPGLQGQAINGTRYSWVFPNMAFAASTEGLWIYEAYPVAPNKCIAYQTLCFPQQAMDHPDFDEKIPYYFNRFDAAVEEDRVALENQQKGMDSPYTVPGPYSPTMEPNVASFAKWYAQQLLA